MTLSRRAFLRSNGVVLTLPFLHSVAVAAKGTPKPNKKLVIIYVPNGLVRRCFFPGEEEGELPGFVGGFNADKTKNQKRRLNEPGIYPLELTSTMQPLAEHTKDVTLVTGLDRTFKNGQDVHAQGAQASYAEQLRDGLLLPAIGLGRSRLLRVEEHAALDALEDDLRLEARGAGHADDHLEVGALRLAHACSSSSRSCS